MKNYIIKFKFVSPVHFGGAEQRDSLYNSDYIMHNDSIFSALCIEANKMYGQSGIDRLVKMCEGNFAISSMMPYSQDTLFLPKPTVIYKGNDNIVQSEEIKNYSKKLKKLKYISISAYHTYNQRMTDGLVLKNIDELSSQLKNLGKNATEQKVMISREGKDNLPYHVGSFTFSKNSGTYIIVQTDNNDDMNYLYRLFNGLSYDGLGGRRSSGYGKFEFEVFDMDDTTNNDLVLLRDMLMGDSDRYMNLSLFLPEQMDNDFLDGAYYTLVRRSGFVESTTYNPDLVKKRDVYAFNVASTFTSKANGQLLDVSLGIGSHPVYKLLKPVFLEVK